jgi:hypothetical protein
LSEELISSRELVRGALRTYRRRAFILAPLTLVSCVPAAFLMIPLAILKIIVESHEPIFMVPVIGHIILAAILLPITVISFLLATGGMLVGYLALTYGVSDEEIGLVGALAKAFTGLGPFAWYSLWNTIYEYAGAILYVPGVVFGVWYAFAPFVFILEGQRGTNALAKSRYYVEGRWGKVFGRLFTVRLVPVVLLFLLLPAFVMTVAFFLPILWSVLSILGIPKIDEGIYYTILFFFETPAGLFLLLLSLIAFLPYDMICRYLLYKNLKASKMG